MVYSCVKVLVGAFKKEMELLLVSRLQIFREISLTPLVVKSSTAHIARTKLACVSDGNIKELPSNLIHNSNRF